MSKLIKSVGIIGSGPVGLFTAYLLLLRPDINCTVTLFDKRSEYSRNQIFLIQRTWYFDLPKKVRKELADISCFIDSPFTSTDAFCYIEKSKPARNFSCRISDFERILKDYLVKEFKHRLFFVNENVSIEQTKILLRNFDIVVGSEGQDSILSKSLNLKKVFYPELQGYGIGVIFRFKNIPTLSKVKHNQNLFRGFTTSNGHGYLGVRLSKEDYTNYSSSKNVARLIDLGMKYYGFTDSVVETVFPIKFEPYFREQVISKINNRINVLLGDSAIGVHYFTGSGVNFGFEMASRFVRLLKKKSLNDIKVPVKKKVKKNIRSLDITERFTIEYLKIVETNLERIQGITLERVDEMCKITPRNFLEQLASNLFRPAFLKAVTHSDLCVLFYDQLYR